MDQVELFQRCAFYFYVSHAKNMKRCSHQMIGIRTFILFVAVLKGHLLDIVVIQPVMFFLCEELVHYPLLIIRFILSISVISDPPR